MKKFQISYMGYNFEEDGQMIVKGNTEMQAWEKARKTLEKKYDHVELDVEEICPTN